MLSGAGDSDDRPGIGWNTETVGESVALHFVRSEIPCFDDESRALAHLGVFERGSNSKATAQVHTSSGE